MWAQLPAGVIQAHLQRKQQSVSGGSSLSFRKPGKYL